METAIPLNLNAPLIYDSAKKPTKETDKISFKLLPQSDGISLIFSQYGTKCIINIFPPRESKNRSRSIEHGFVELNVRSTVMELESDIVIR